MKRCLVLSLIVLVAALGCAAREIVVNSTADNGSGTLRWALQTAQSGDVITFDPEVFPPKNPATIYPRSELPQIHCGNLTIDASNAGVIIDGINVPGDWNNGLQVYSDRNIVMGLQIVSFAGPGIVVAGAQNTIGGDRRTGVGPIGQGNLTSGNTFGIDLCDVGTSDNEIVGNLVGVHADATTPWGNAALGICIEDNVHDNAIGPRNVIANNERGIVIRGAGAVRNVISQNTIYDNSEYGIQLSGGANSHLLAPVLLDFVLSNGMIEGFACPNCRIEIFSDHGAEGEYFEGCTMADSAGKFMFQKGSAFLGPNLTAVAVDTDGNSSRFSNQTFGEEGSARIQGQNDQPRSLIQTMESSELADNRIGDFPEIRNTVEQLDYFLQTGFTWQKVELLAGTHGGTFWETDWHSEGYSLDPDADAAITQLAGSGVNLIVCLGCLSEQFETAQCGRFKIESEIQLYLSYVRSVVRHFKGRIVYYDVWNEPNNPVPDWYVEVPDYIDFALRAIAVIREEDPAAKIVVGSVGDAESPEGRAYMSALLRSELMPLVDVVAWHPGSGTSPSEDCYCSEYYYEYPTIIREFKAIASAHGFEGEYRAAEINWRTPRVLEGYWQPMFSAPKCAKYYARGILMHLGMDVMAGVITWGDNPIAESVFRYLCTLMAGHEAIDMPVEIACDEVDGPVEYAAFRYPSGDRILAIWRNVVAQDDDSSTVFSTITIPGLTASTVTGIDVLHGFEQELIFEIESDDTIVRDLLVKDYPTLIRLSDVTVSADYQETVSDGFHRLGEPGAAADRDGDGVPDDEDFCPDWPGSAATSGC